MKPRGFRGPGRFRRAGLRWRSACADSEHPAAATPDCDGPGHQPPAGPGPARVSCKLPGGMDERGRPSRFPSPPSASDPNGEFLTR